MELRATHGIKLAGYQVPNALRALGVSREAEHTYYPLNTPKRHDTAYGAVQRQDNYE